jgi:cell division protein FtsB
MITVLLIADAIIGERGLLEFFQTSREHTQLREAIAMLHEENDQLNRYIQALTAEPRFLENEARRELGMIKPGEQLFLVRTTTPASSIKPAASLEDAPTGTDAN